MCFLYSVSPSDRRTRQEMKALVWKQTGGQLVVAVIGLLNDTENEVRAAALRAIDIMVFSHRDHFSKMVDILLRSLIRCCEKEKQAGKADFVRAQEVLVRVARNLSAPSCAHAMIPLLKAIGKSASESCKLQMAIKVVNCVADNMASSTLHEAIPELIPSIVNAMTASTSGVRKEAVFTFVKYYMLVGEALMPYFEHMDMPQRKLVTIYIEREQRKQQN